jgi:tRNA threonylcarbamoyladenosine biosynthesis protein TsaB
VRLLGFETATAGGAVALGIDGAIEEAVATTERRHAETILPTAIELMERRGMDPHELDGIVIDVGPGLFTGLRVGIATARSLAYAAGLPLYCVTSLELLAHDASLEGAPELLAAVDARRGELFVQRFERSSTGISAVDAARVVDPSVLVAELAELDHAILAVGDGARRYVELLETLEQLEVAGPSIPSPTVGIELVERGLIPANHDPSVVLPLYLRDPDAVANFSVAASLSQR